jgi:hypothetical protein
MSQWLNDDGLRVLFESEQATPDVKNVPVVNTMGAYNQMVVEFDYNDLPAETTDRNNDGTNDGWSGADPYIPANSYIIRATLVVITDFATGDAATLDIGLSQLDGTVIDADGD